MEAQTKVNVILYILFLILIVCFFSFLLVSFLIKLWSKKDTGDAELESRELSYPVIILRIIIIGFLSFIPSLFAAHWLEDRLEWVPLMLPVTILGSSVILSAWILLTSRDEETSAGRRKFLAMIHAMIKVVGNVLGAIIAFIFLLFLSKLLEPVIDPAIKRIFNKENAIPIAIIFGAIIIAVAINQNAKK